MEGGFSIRGYASRMRSVNVVNCWPFDEAISADTVKSLLPPIVVKRFTWWLDELESLSSESAEKLAIREKKTKRVSERGETSSRNAGGDSEGGKEVKLKSLKGKMRATKKRSILEIFAVTPSVKRAISSEEEEEEEEEEEDDDDDDDDDDNLGINRALKRRRRKRRRKKMKNTDAILRKALRAVKKIKRRKAAAAAAAEKPGWEIPDKENCFKLKQQTQEKAHGKSSLLCSKEVANDIHDFLSIPKRKGANKKLVPCKSSKLIEENQHLELPVRSILKNRDKEFPLKQSKKCILQEAVQLSNGSAQKNKHVTFSENGEVLRLSRKPSQECFVLQKDCTSDIGNVAVGKDSTVLETSGSEDAPNITGKELGAEPSINEQFSRFSINETTFEKQIYEVEYSTSFGSSDRRAMCSVNQHWTEHSLADAPHNKMDAYSPIFLHMPHEGYYNNANMKVIMASSNATCGRLNKDMRTPCPIFPPLCFEDYLRTHDNASMSHLSSNMRRAYKQTQASPENTAVNCAHAIHFQTIPHCFPTEVLQTFCSLPDGIQTGDVCGRNANGINEEFVGLPVNSQGELVALNSISMREANQMMNPSAAQCIGSSLPSSGHHSEYRDLDGRTSSPGQLNLFPVESYVKESAMAVLPSRLGIIESQSERANLDLDFLETNYHTFHNSVKTMPKGDSHLPKSPENEKFQSTLRLMGKEFEVSGKGVQGFEDGRMWKDKQIIDELHFRNEQNEPSLRQLRDTLFCPSEITVNHRSESKYLLPHVDIKTSSMYKSVFPTRTIDSAQKLYPGGLSPCTFSDVYSKSLFSKPYAAGYDSQFFTLELPTTTAPHQELRSDMGPGATHLKKNKQSLQYSPISSIKFPFIHQDLNGHASWPRRSSLVQHPLCLDVSKKATQLSNTLYCAPGHNHPYLNPGTSCAINGSVSFQSDDFCMFCPLPSGQSVAPAPVPYYSGVLPVSAMQRKLGNQHKIKERIKSRIGVRGLDIGKKSNAPFKPFKRPILGFHEGHQHGVRKPAACITFENTVMEGEAFEPYDPTTKDGQTILPWSDSYIQTARTSPVKLTAGAKHVLKPRQQKDHMPTDQDIPLSATNIGLRSIQHRCSDFEAC